MPIAVARCNVENNTIDREEDCNIVGLETAVRLSRAKSVTSDLSRGERSRYSFTPDYNPRYNPTIRMARQRQPYRESNRTSLIINFLRVQRAEKPRRTSRCETQIYNSQFVPNKDSLVITTRRYDIRENFQQRSSSQII